MKNKFLSNLNYKNLLFILGILLFLGIIIALPNTKVILCYIFLLFIILSGAFTISSLFNSKFEESLPVYFFSIFFVIYCFSLFNILKIGTYFLIITTILSACYCLYKNLKNKKYDAFKLYFRPSFYIFIVLFILFSYFTSNAAFYIWDEFNFWSIASKNMYYLNNSYIINGTNLYVFYPPNPIYLEYFFEKVLRTYSQGIELFTCIMFGYSLMFPFFKSENKKLSLKNFFIVATIIVIPSIFCDHHFYQTVYVDCLLGILTGYVLFEYFNTDDFKYKLIKLFLSIFVLTLTKPIGVVLSALLIVIIMLDLFFKNINKINKKQKISIICVGLLSILLSFGSWKIYFSKNIGIINNGYINNQFFEYNSVIDMISCIYNTSIGSGVVENNNFKNFISDFLENKNYVVNPFCLNGKVIIALFIIGFYFIYKSDKETKRKIVLSFLLVIMYVLFIECIYYLKFSLAEANSHSSLERYIGTIFMFLLYMLYGELFVNKKIKKECIKGFMIALFVLTPFSCITDATIHSASYNAMKQAGVRNQKAFAEYVLSRTTDKDRIFAIHQTQGDDSFLLQVRYFMTPRMIPLIDEFSDNETYTYVKFKDYIELQNELYDKYDYVVIINSNEYFDNKYSILFKDEKVYGWSLYKIQKNQDRTILLERVD